MKVKNYNLFSCFSEQLERCPNKQLIITEDGKSFNFNDINTESARIASYLARVGVKPGDRISVQVEKSPESLFLYLACLRAGFIYHPLNPEYKTTELVFFLNDAEPTIMICDDRNLKKIKSLRLKTQSIKSFLTLNGDGSGTLIEQSKSAEKIYKTFHTPKDHLAALLYSSGTTGTPKGIMLSHMNLISNAKTLTQSWHFSKKDVLLHALPIFHVHGLFVAIGCALLSAASMNWINKFNAKKIVQLLPQSTVFMGVPTYYTRLLSEPDFSKTMCSSMRVFISGSAPLLEETFRTFKNRTGHSILERYGMTETNMNTSNPIEGERKPGTVGPPLPGVNLRVVDQKNTILGVNRIGNLQVKGSNVFMGYWKMPDKTAIDFTKDGFFNTGDKAKIGEDGYISIVGRSKDMIITGGLNVYPKEIETIIDQIEYVNESAVIGVPHNDFGEAVVVIVVLSQPNSIDEKTIISYAKEKLANFKIPKKVIFVEKLPRNTMGKVQKNVLREMHESLFS